MHEVRLQTNTTLSRALICTLLLSALQIHGFDTTLPAPEVSYESSEPVVCIGEVLIPNVISPHLVKRIPNLNGSAIIKLQEKESATLVPYDLIKQVTQTCSDGSMKIISSTPEPIFQMGDGRPMASTLITGPAEIVFKRRSEYPPRTEVRIQENLQDGGLWGPLNHQHPQD